MSIYYYFHNVKTNNLFKREDTMFKKLAICSILFMSVLGHADNLKDIQIACLVNKNARSCSTLGLMYKCGLGTKEDKPMAAMYYWEACNGGESSGCYEAGNMHYMGDGVEKDYFAAAFFYEKACDGGEAFGCTSLGVMYLAGQGVERDPIKAAVLFKKGL